MWVIAVSAERVTNLVTPVLLELRMEKIVFTFDFDNILFEGSKIVSRMKPLIRVFVGLM